MLSFLKKKNDEKLVTDFSIFFLNLKKFDFERIENKSCLIQFGLKHVGVGTKNTVS